MAQIVTLPSLGFAILEASIIKWMKKEGDVVAKEEPMASVESDKVTYDVVSPIDGVLLKQVHPAGEIVKVDSPIAIVGQAGESIKDVDPAVSSAETASTSEKKITDTEQTNPDIKFSPQKRIKATPVAKKLCREHDIDISQVTGTGSGGAVSRDDVLAYIENKKSAPNSVVSTPISDEDEIIPFSGVRKSIANSLFQSYTNAVHVTTLVEVDMTDSDYLRRMLKDSFYEAEGFKLSFLPFFIKASILGLRKFPILNASLQDEEIIIKKNVDFSIAVDTEKGLMIPVLKSANLMTFWDIARAVNKIITTSKEGNILPEYFGQGTISLSNAGAYGAVTSTPIIANNQSAVIWTGAIIDKPAVKDGKISIRKIMNLCTSYDHRIIDGAKVAQFLGVMKDSLENPGIILMN